MRSFPSFNSRLSKKIGFGMALASSLLISTAAVFTTTPARASVTSVPMFSVQNAPYSRVFYTGSSYAVKDRDYDADNSSVGFFSLWGKNPVTHDLQVSIQYCLKDPSLAKNAAELTGITLLNDQQPVLTIRNPIKAKLSRRDTLRPGYYTSSYVVDNTPWLDYPFWDAMDWDFFSDNLAYVPSEYVPAKTCAVGSSRFDLSKMASQISQLPDRTLQVQLNFSDGETQTQHLGKGTVEALKQLIQLSD